MGNKKNLLFVFADQWRRSALGAYGEEPVKTPCMDQFAKNGVLCRNAVSACPLCSPARASLMTGQYPLKTGIFTNCKTGSGIHLKEKEVCISDVLSDNGYNCGYIGKWHLDEPEMNYENHPVSGAKAWDAYTLPGNKRHGFDFWHAYNAWDEHLTPHYWEDSSRMIKVNKWSPIHETDVAISFLDKRDKEKPFALFLAWNPPHSPYTTAPDKEKLKYKNLDYLRANVDVDKLSETKHHTFEKMPLDLESAKQLQRDYFAAISGLDTEFGRLMEYLEKENLIENTIVVLTADHGDMLGSHTLAGKHVWFEESIGIPFIIGCGGIEKGECNTVFSSQDIPSTLLSFLDLEAPGFWDGKDVSGDIKDSVTDKNSYTYIVACPGRDIFIKEFQKCDKNIIGYGWRGIRTTRYTFVISVGYKTDADLEYYLYDNQSDPFQMSPLKGTAARESEAGRALEKKLLNWLQSESDPFLKTLEEL